MGEQEWKEEGEALRSEKREQTSSAFSAFPSLHACSGWPYETHITSLAYVPQENQWHQPYFSAHLYGGTASEFHSIMEECRHGVVTDRDNGFQARVDDESHINHYFFVHPPTVTLSRSFCFPGEKTLLLFNSHSSSICSCSSSPDPFSRSSLAFLPHYSSLLSPFSVVFLIFCTY